MFILNMSLWSGMSFIGLLSIVHCYPTVIDIMAGILLHVVSLCVTIIVPSCTFVYMFIVSVHYVLFCLFSNCFKLSSTVSVHIFLFNWSLSYCLAVISVAFMCLLFLVISHPVFVMHITCDLLLWLWPPSPIIMPWVHAPSSSQWTSTVDPIGMKA